MRPWLPPFTSTFLLKASRWVPGGAATRLRKNWAEKRRFPDACRNTANEEFLTLCSRVRAVERCDECGELRGHDARDGEKVGVRLA
jgi:hypothetical protein